MSEAGQHKSMPPHHSYVLCAAGIGLAGEPLALTDLKSP